MECQLDSEKLHEVCVEKIVDNTEQPLKAIQSMQIGQSF